MKFLSFIFIGIVILGTNDVFGAKKSKTSPPSDPKAEALAAALDHPDEQMLSRGPFSAKADSDIQKTFTPWRLEWESYPYKRFYPSVNEAKSFWSHRDPDKVPGKDQLPFKEGQRPGVQAKEAFVIRFFEVTEDMNKDHTRKAWLRWPSALNKSWETHDVLRMDVEFSADGHVWWALEDRFIQPPVVGNFEVKANTPVTLEIDLQEAVKARSLDLKNIWRTWVRHNLTEGSGEFKNIRLSRRDVPSKFPIVRDAESTLLPTHPVTTKALPSNIPQDLTPLSNPVTLTYKASTPLTILWGGDRKAGGMAIYDSQHILLCLSKMYGKGNRFIGKDYDPFVTQTLDGAKTWKGFQDNTERTYLIPTVGLQSEAIDSQGGFIFHDEDGCQNDPGPRHRMTVFRFEGKNGWMYNLNKYIFEEEGRQCSHYGNDWSDFMRTPSGRIWTALRVLGRDFPDWRGVNVKYSDNEGKSWHSWREGFVATIPGSQSFKGYPYPRLAAYGDYVAAFFRKEREDEHHQWTYFDGKQWAPLQEIPMSITSVLGVSPKEILAAGDGGVMRLENNKWVSELTMKGNAGTLVKSGDNILLIGTSGGGGKSKASGEDIHVRYRSPDGKWSDAQIHKTGPIKEMYVPRFCPSNLAAVAYINSDDLNSAKILLVPSQKSGRLIGSR